MSDESRSQRVLHRVALEREEIHRAVEVVRSAARTLLRSRLPQMAAALAFRTIFGLVPVLVVGLVMLRLVTTQADIERALDRIFVYAGIKQITIDTGTDAESQTESVDVFIQNVVSGVESLEFRAIGIVGVLILAYASVSMLVEVERAFNHVYRATSGRPWLRRLTQYWTMLTLGGVFLFASFIVGEKFKGWVQAMGESGTLPFSGSLAITLAGFIVTVMISTLLLLAMYTTVPHARVKVRPALAGAMVAAVLWETGKWGFTEYLSFSTSYSKIYGSIALIPIFLMWVYLTWLIVLFGLQVAYGIQTFSTWQLSSDSGDENEPQIVDPSAILLVLADVARRFRQGSSTSASDVAEETSVPCPVAAEMLSRLAMAHLIHPVEGWEGEPSGNGSGSGSFNEDEPSYSLARPPEEIRLADVLTVGQKLGLADPDRRRAGLLKSLQQAQIDSVGDRRVSSLLDIDTDAEPSERSEA